MEKRAETRTIAGQTGLGRMKIKNRGGRCVADNFELVRGTKNNETMP